MLEGISPKSNEIGDFYQIGWPDPWPQPIPILKRNLFAPINYNKKQNWDYARENKIMNKEKLSRGYPFAKEG